ncbi:hypothetical protein EAI_06070 [Harpegnathos saltator]|uniref:Uncharacterized protein n=1 Tax=Harpegnathos saltator TaxID=610380 RepID=E2B4C1_HARSA|nr:hypothetical protein EAI_06070 [Harpegnathos saltator]
MISRYDSISDKQKETPWMRQKEQMASLAGHKNVDNFGLERRTVLPRRGHLTTLVRYNLAHSPSTGSYENSIVRDDPFPPIFADVVPTRSKDQRIPEAEVPSITVRNSNPASLQAS